MVGRVQRVEEGAEGGGEGIEVVYCRPACYVPSLRVYMPSLVEGALAYLSFSLM